MVPLKRFELPIEDIREPNVDMPIYLSTSKKVLNETIQAVGIVQTIFIEESID